MNDLLWMSAVSQARLIRSREISAADLVRAAIDRIEQTDGLNVIVAERFDQALAEADGALPDGPFTGVPVLLKDLGCEQAGEPSYMGSSVLRDAGRVGRQDAVLVERLRAAGFVILGRTTSPEFGIRSSTESRAFGTTRNPWNRQRSTGGSSGGSAAAVAAGIVSLAQGSDGAGSLRMPATLCGVVALKPTHNLISQAPDWEVMTGHSEYGPLARHLEDISGFLRVTAGRSAGDPPGGAPFAADLGRGAQRRLRIGLCITGELGGVEIDPGVIEAVLVAGQILSDAGHEVEVTWPAAYGEADYLEHFIDAIAPTLVDLLGGLQIELGLRLDPARDIEPASRYWYERGLRLSAGDFAATLRWLGDYRRRMAMWWESGWDVLVAPSFPTASHALGRPEDGAEATRRNIDLVRTTAPFNTTGQPALTVPVLVRDGDCPVGVQLVGAPYSEASLLRLGAEIEESTGSSRWRPAGLGPDERGGSASPA